MFFIFSAKKIESEVTTEVFTFDQLNTAKAELHKLIGKNYEDLNTGDISGFTVSMLDTRGFSIYNESDGMEEQPMVPDFSR